jgi:hypothetical protein
VYAVLGVHQLALHVLAQGCDAEKRNSERKERKEMKRRRRTKNEQKKTTAEYKWTLAFIGWINE